MSAKCWGKKIKIAGIVYFFSFIIVVLFLSQVGDIGLVPSLIIIIVLCSPLVVLGALVDKYWKCPSCQNKLPVHSRSSRSILIMPKLSTPYCPKCGADIDVVVSHSAPDARDIDTITSTSVSDAKLSRAMAVTILHRLAGEPVVTSCPSTIFIDVPPGQWFSNAIAWASHREILLETGGGRFAPRADVTREQFTTMLYRYSVTMGFSVEVPEGFNLTTFPDHDQISTWANESMRWAVYNHLITGKDTYGTLYPRGSATRAQCIAILQRFVKLIA